MMVGRWPFPFGSLCNFSGASLLLPSWELTLSPPKVCLKIFLFPRWNLLVSWSVRPLDQHCFSHIEEWMIFAPWKRSIRQDFQNPKGIYGRCNWSARIVFAAESFCFLGGVDFVDFYGGGKSIQNIMEHQSFKGRRNQFLCVFCTKIAVVRCWPIGTYKTLFVCDMLFFLASPPTLSAYAPKKTLCCCYHGRNESIPENRWFSHSFLCGADLRGCITSHCSRAVWEAAGGPSRISSCLE